MSKLNSGSLYYFNKILDERVNSAVQIFGEGAVPEQIEIAVFREGKYEHYWYGTLDITKEYLNGLVRNFNAKVCPTDISANADHLPQYGSYGWMENEVGNLYVKDVTYSTPNGDYTKSVLMAKFTPNKKGRKAIMEDEFRYISAEIHPNFKSPEVFSIGSDGGEGLIEYGPTLTGFALTNRPFIPNMQKVFSEGQEVEVKEYSTIISGDVDEIGSFASVKYTETNDTKQQNFNKQVDNSASDRDGECMNFNDFASGVNGAESLDAKLNFSEANISKVDAKDKAMADMIFASLKDQKESKEQSERLASRLVDAENKAKSFSEQNDELLLTLARSKDSEYSSKVDAKAAELVSEGYPVAVANKIKDICLSVPNEKEISVLVWMKKIRLICLALLIRFLQLYQKK